MVLFGQATIFSFSASNNIFKTICRFVVPGLLLLLFYFPRDFSNDMDLKTDGSYGNNDFFLSD